MGLPEIAGKSDTPLPPDATDARSTSSSLPRLPLEAILNADLARGLAMIFCTSS
jgi:hypothetical protein